MADPILVYVFHDAPQELQDLSTNGGDEDWLAVVPAAIVAQDPWMRWLECPAFGVCNVDEFMLPDGRKVVIGCHS